MIEENNIPQKETPNSCKIAINAKGIYSGEIKVYAGTSMIALDEAIIRANQLEAHIKNKNERKE